MKTFSRNYLRKWTVTASACLAVVICANLLVDPFRAYRGIHLDSIESSRTGADTRSGKAEMVARGDYDTLIIGSSRTEMGIDPNHPAWPGERAVNASLVGSSFYELAHVFDLAVAERTPEHVYLFLDLYMFGLPSMGKADFARSRFSPNFSAFTYHLENLVGLWATKQTVKSLAYWSSGREASTSDQGFRPGEGVVYAQGLRALNAKILTNVAAPRNLRGFDYNQDSMDHLTRVIDTCRDRGIPLSVAIMPKHATYFETVYQLGLWDQFETWKRDVCQIVASASAITGSDSSIPLHDFTTYNEAVEDPIPIAGDVTSQMDWFIEVTHFNTRFGDRVIEAMHAPADVDRSFGPLVTDASLDDHLARIRDQREAYALTHPGEVQGVSECLGLERDSHLRDRRFAAGDQPAAPPAQSASSDGAGTSASQ